MTAKPLNVWKRYYTRSFWQQDFEMPTVFPTMEQSKNKVTEALFIPNEGKMEAWWRQDQWEVYLRDIAQDFQKPNFSLQKHKAQFVAARATLEQTVKSFAAQAPTAEPQQLLVMIEELRNS